MLYNEVKISNYIINNGLILTTSLFSLFAVTCFRDLLSPSSALLQLSGSFIGLQMSLFNGFKKQINMEGGQSGTYLRLPRASSGLRVSVAKTYRDETKRK